MAIAFNPLQPPSIGGIGQVGGIGAKGGIAPGYNIPGIQIIIMTGGVAHTPGMMGAMHGFGSQFAGMSSIYNQIPGHGDVPGIRPPAHFGIGGGSHAMGQVVKKQEERYEIREEKSELKEKLNALMDKAEKYENKLNDKNVEIVGKEHNIQMTEAEKKKYEGLKNTEEHKKLEFEETKKKAQKRYNDHQYENWWPWNISKTLRHKSIRNEASGVINACNVNIKKANDKISDLNNRINENNKDIAQLSREKEKLTQEKNAIESEYYPIKAELEKIKSQLAVLEHREDKFSDEIRDLRN